MTPTHSQDLTLDRITGIMPDLLETKRAISLGGLSDLCGSTRPGFDPRVGLGLCWGVVPSGGA